MTTYKIESIFLTHEFQRRADTHAVPIYLADDVEALQASHAALVEALTMCRHAIQAFQRTDHSALAIKEKIHLCFAQHVAIVALAHAQNGQP